MEQKYKHLNFFHSFFCMTDKIIDLDLFCFLQLLSIMSLIIIFIKAGFS